METGHRNRGASWSQNHISGTHRIVTYPKEISIENITPSNVYKTPAIRWTTQITKNFA